jgi:ubiquinone/menaquinone biosynthesis C-methylase UbiE
MESYWFARIYDPLVEPVLTGLREDLTHSLVELHIKNILDVGCGTGSQLRRLAGKGIQCTGIDRSEGMLRVARKKSSGIDYIQADATALPFREHHFQAAIISLALHEKSPEEGRMILREMLRVLQPDGYLIIVDYHFTEGRQWIADKAVSLAEFLVGGEHYRNFRYYRKNGELNNVIDGLPLKHHASRNFAGGTIALNFFQPV